MSRDTSKPRNVFHHLTTKAQNVATAVDDARTEHKVAQRPGIRPPWAGKPASQRAAQCGLWPKVRWFAGKHLAVRGQQ
jgi:hypothetical protein